MIGDAIFGRGLPAQPSKEEYDDGEGAGAYASPIMSEMLVGLPISDSRPQLNITGVVTGDCIGLLNPSASGSNGGRCGLEKLLATNPKASKPVCAQAKN